jgi:hypothetical protein
MKIINNDILIQCLILKKNIGAKRIISRKIIFDENLAFIIKEMEIMAYILQ